MVKEVEKNDEILYQCEACDFVYRDKKLSQKCEDWCKEKNSCNMEIAKHAIKLD